MTNPQQPWVTDTPRSEVEAADERLTRSGAPEVRGDYSARQDAERAGMPNLSDDEIESAILAEYENAVLASPPALAGYHLCWLTTSSQYDTIQKRQRVGYVPVMRSEMPGFDPSMGSALANFEGMVTCNELVLHKIPDRNYQILMNLFHHKKPAGAEKGIVQSIKEANASTVNEGGEGADPGFTQLERSVKYAEQVGDPRF